METRQQQAEREAREREMRERLERERLAREEQERRIRESAFAGVDPSIRKALEWMEASTRQNIAASVADGIDRAFQATNAKIDGLTSWQQDLDARVSDLHAVVVELQKPSSAPPPSESMAANLAASQPDAFHHDVPAASRETHGQGHGSVYITRGLPTGTSVPATPPVTGAYNPHLQCAASAQWFQNSSPASPPMQFPVFNGEHPKLWRTLCEQYFLMYGTQESYWVTMAILNFAGAASIWLQSVRNKVVLLGWDEFRTLLCTRFGRDRHQLLIRQFYSIKQTSTVTEYIERFEILVNHLASYSDTIHPYYLLTRFIEGLRKDIRAVVMVQRPQDLDTACSLACLQEEVIAATQADRGYHETNPFLAPAAFALPLPAPPPRALLPAQADDRRRPEVQR
jgi:hypothetical protein